MPTYFSLDMNLKIVADSWEQLRSIDLDRLFYSCDQENRQLLKWAAIERRPDMREKIEAAYEESFCD